MANNAINSNPQNRRFALLSPAGYGEPMANQPTANSSIKFSRSIEG